MTCITHIRRPGTSPMWEVTVRGFFKGRYLTREAAEDCLTYWTGPGGKYA